MPGFKPKFAVPSSQNVADKLNICEINKSSTLSSGIVKILTKPDSSPNSKSHDSHILQLDHESSSKLTENKPLQGLSDEQYEDIFASVLAKAASGTLETTSRTTNHCDPLEAAMHFTQRTQNISPTNVQVQNEITPNTSPQDEATGSPKLLLQRPVKKKSVKADNDHKENYYKRKTLDFVPSKSCKGRGHTLLEKCEKKMKQRKHRSDSHIVLQRKKVLNKGLWVQCGQKDCLKWRYLQNCSDPSSLPDFWICSMNEDDPTQNKCTIPEIDWSSCLSSSQDHFIYSEYNAGSIVWARMAGYPPWPAMIDSDPDTNLFYEYDHLGAVLQYHVVFLDENVSRAWLSSRSIEPYERNSSNKVLSHGKTRDFKVELQSAMSAAEDAIKLTMEERLEKYSFEKRYLASRHKEWTPKRSSRKKHHHKSLTKITKSPVGQQVVPNKDVDSDTATIKSSRALDEEYSEKADDTTHHTDSGCIDENLPQVSLTKSPTKEANSEYKRAKSEKPSKTCKQLSAVVEKARMRAAFKAPSKKPKRDDASNAVVPSSPLAGNKHARGSPRVASPEVAVQADLKFDPDIYTMELNGSQNARSDEKSSNKKTDDVTDDAEGKDEALNLSLKYNTYEGDKDSPVLNKDAFGKGFWDTVTDKKDLAPEDDDPFSDLVMENNEDMLQDWDEEKIKQLDELMPVITDHF